MARLMDRMYAVELRTKLMLLFLLIAVIPLAFLGSFSYRKASAEIQSKAYEIILKNLSQVNHSLTYFINDVEQLSMYIYSNEQIQTILSKPLSRSIAEKYKDQQAMGQILDSFLGFKSWDIQLYLLGANGDRYFTGSFLPDEYRDYNSNWGLLRKATLASGDVAWDTHYSLKKMEDYGAVLSSGRLLKRIGTGEPLGYLVIDVMEPALADLYPKTQQYPDGETYLLDSNGYVISSMPSKLQVGTRLNKSYVSEVIQGKKGFFRIKEKSTESMVIYDTSETSQFKMVNVVPIRLLTKESTSIRNLTVFIVISGILVSYCLSYLLADYVTGPLRKLRRLMKEVEQGNLDVAFNSRHKDEVGHLGVSFNHMIQRIKLLINQVYEKQIKVQEAEIKAIQAQFTPHFLYNALDSINWMGRLHRVEAISRTALALGDLLRFSIRRENAVIPIREDVKQIRNYLTIQQLRYGDKIVVEMDLDDDILDLYTPKLLIQPLVENAISHGLEMKKGNGFLHISGRRAEGFVEFMIKDDGVGIPQEKLNRIWGNQYMPDGSGNTGIGLRNLRRRLELHFGTSFRFDIRSEPGKGTNVMLRIPILKEAKEVERHV